MPRLNGSLGVILAPEDVAAFAARWPCSGLDGDRTVTAWFAADGTLEDYFGVPPDADDAAVGALLEDAYTWMVGAAKGSPPDWPIINP